MIRNNVEYNLILNPSLLYNKNEGIIHFFSVMTEMIGYSNFMLVSQLVKLGEFSFLTCTGYVFA